MAWLWARIHDRTQELGYLKGGFHQFYRALAARVATRGGHITYGVEADRIERLDDGLRVSAGLRSLTFDRVVSTLPLHVTARLTPELSHQNHRPASTLTPRSAQCMILALDRPLTGIYWIGAIDPGWPFVAIVEHTAMLGTDGYGGRHLLYLGAYRDASDPRLHLTLPELQDQALPVLQELNPAFSPEWVTDAWLFSSPNAQPIVDVGYRRRISSL